MPRRYSQQQIEAFAETALRDGYCVIREYFPRAKLLTWQSSFGPLLARHIEREGKTPNRGSGRYYVTLPFLSPWADPEIFEDDDLLAIVEKLVGQDFVMCQLATDTPVLGSEYQDVHRDTQPLFPESGKETPPYQLAVNFPLVDVTRENGPIEIARGTHMMSRAEGMAKLEAGEVKLEPIPMQVGDVMIRDVRGLHRGTPNTTKIPRPMVVIGYSRRWLFRPEVSIRIPKAVWAALSDRARHMLRFNPRVESVPPEGEPEIYQSFAY